MLMHPTCRCNSSGTQECLHKPASQDFQMLKSPAEAKTLLCSHDKISTQQVLEFDNLESTQARNKATELTVIERFD